VMPGWSWYMQPLRGVAFWHEWTGTRCARTNAPSRLYDNRSARPSSMHLSGWWRQGTGWVARRCTWR